MKNLFINLKKTNKYYRIIFFTLFFIFTLSTIFIIKALLLLKNIETFIRLTVIIIFIILILLYLISNLVFLILKKHKSIIVTSVIAVLFTAINITGFYYINKTYMIIDNISKDKILYSTSLVALNETTDIKKVGMISREDDTEGYVLPKEYIKENNLKYNIKSYDDYYVMLNDLYDKKIDAIFLTSNYATVYNNDEKFENIKEETKIIYTYSKDMKNQDIIEGSNRSITEPFTILMMGIDSKVDGLSKGPSSNADSLILVTFNPRTLNATMFGIPRDTYVPIACNNNKNNKINSASHGGSKCVIDTIENLIGIDIDYYAKINFKGLVKLVDVIGGVKVDVPVPDDKKEYCIEDSDRVSRKICLTPGVQTLNGEEALALSRVRYAFNLGDFKRVQNQQIVLEAILKKIKSIKNINSFLNVLETISNNLDTNMKNDQILNFYNVGKDIVNRNKINDNEFINIERTYLRGYDSHFGNHRSYAFQYFKNSLDEIKDAMLVNLELKEPKIIKTFDFSINKEYKVKIIGDVHSDEKRLEMLPNFKNETLDYVQNWIKDKNLTLNIENIKSNECLHNTVTLHKTNGVIISTINSLTIEVCNNVNSNNENTEKDDNKDLDKNEKEEEEKIEEPIENMLN